MYPLAIYQNIAITFFAIQYLAVFVYMTFDDKIVMKSTTEIIGSIKILFLIVHNIHLTF